jgi:CRP-like cAMP-binding protein
MTPSRIALLQRMPIFGAIGQQSLEFLVGQAGTAQVGAGDSFFREGEVGDTMYVLESGRAEVIRSWQGRELRLHALGPGDCFGEMALLDLSPRSASVRALEPSSAMRISAADLYALFERDAEQFALIQMNLAREMSRRLRRTDEQLFRLWVGADATVAAPPDFRDT